jgi:Rad3-related DNA helicase
MEAMTTKLNPDNLEHRQKIIQEGIKYMKSLKQRGKQTRPHLLRQTLVERFPDFEQEAVIVADEGFNIMDKFSTAFSQFQNGKPIDRSLLEIVKPKEEIKKASTEEAPKKEQGKWTEKFKKL